MHRDSVFVLQHVAREDEDDEDVKLIGVYSSQSSAEAAVSRIMLQSGFADFPEGFYVDEYEIDEDHWAEGFASVDPAIELSQQPPVTSSRSEQDGGGAVSVRPGRPEDARAWLEMRLALWPEDAEGEHREEIERFFAGDFPRWPWAVLVAEDGNGRAIGFAEVSVRPYAEGCRDPRVAYLEGWFVSPDARERGVGRALVRAAEEWGRSRGCRELASDADPQNGVSAAAHAAAGFVDAGLVRCFRKDL